MAGVPQSPLQRFGNNDFFFEKNYIGPGPARPDDETTFKIEMHVKGRKLDAHSRHEMAKEAQRKLEGLSLKQLQNIKKLDFNIGDTKCTISPTTSKKFSEIILKDYFFTPSKDKVVHLEISADSWIKEASPLENPEGIAPPAENIRDINSIDASPYSDPFTKLATEAFQEYESELIGHDYEAPSSCDFRYVLIDDQLKLVHKNSPEATPENRSAAKFLYLKFIMDTYGNEKFEHINKHYRLNLEGGDELTPEHVHRFNIGTTTLDVQDIKSLAKRLSQLKEDARDEDPEAHLVDILKGKLPIAELRALNEAIKPNGKATLNEFREWMMARIDNASPNRLGFEDLRKILTPASEDLERCFTGRKIFGGIKSASEAAGTREFKPWIEQQELMQIRQEIADCPSWEAYQEILAHIIAKRQLLKPIEGEGYQVGTLIPAPPLVKGGEPRWYAITSCITNGYIYSYTLESANKDPTLPSIKLYRSTASSNSALFSQRSVMNDLNLFNAPGYMGLSLLIEYEKKFFDEHSIPMWVAIQQVAAKKLSEEGASTNEKDLADTNALLTSANQKLLASHTRVDRKSFVDILKDNDAILSELMYQGGKEKTVDERFVAIVDSYINKYLDPSKDPSKISSAEAKKDATALKQHLIQYTYRSRTDPHEQAQIKKLINDLDRNIFTEISDAEYQEKVTRFKTSYDSLDGLQKRANKLLIDAKKLKGDEKEKALKNAHKALAEWSSAIDAIAIDSHENVSSKKPENVQLSGHSLGGACSQAGMVRYFAKEDRVPLPNGTCTAYLFDDPAISREDNQLFKRFGNDNADILEELNIHFNIFRRQESHDIVSRGGDEHLGSTMSDEEAASVKSWMGFDAAVNERLGESRKTGIHDSRSVHETRFLAGERKRTLVMPEKMQPAMSLQDFLEREEEVPRENIHDFLAPPKVRKDPLHPDFLQTNYDSRIQGVFDKVGRVQTTKAGAGEEAFEEVRENLWKIPKTVVDAMSETHRRSTNAVIMDARRKLVRHTQSTNLVDKESLDNHGVLAITLEDGVISRKAA